jgi:RNA polymerase sigma factor (TIGR02999 family)
MPEDATPDMTQLLDAAGRGDAAAAEQLLPLVYSELHRLARIRMKQERAGHTLQPTALVHEAYLRLVGNPDTRWDGRGHFFGAAAIAMRRILVERARARGRVKRGGDRQRVEFDEAGLTEEPPATDLIVLDDTLNRLEQYDPRKYRVVMLRFFAGLTIEETAAAMDLSPATVKNEWTFARAWLHREMGDTDPQDAP